MADAPKWPTSFKDRHNDGNHLLIHEGGKFSYVLIPPLLSLQTEESKLCFTDHNGDKWDPRVQQCCLREGGHVHAHVHRGDTIEDIFLEECGDEAGCTLPMPWELPGSCLQDFSDSKEEFYKGDDHMHREGCGHIQIAHGDHMDWLVPMSDGSFVLSHADVTNDGAYRFIHHGRLVKVGESQGKLKQHFRQFLDLFGYEGPHAGGSIIETATMNLSKDLCTGVMAARLSTSATSPPIEQASNATKEASIKLQIDSEVGLPELQKTTIDVLGICCPAEVPLVKKILEPVPGVHQVMVNVAARTVTVHHESLSVSAAHLVKLLNDARLEASIHHVGEWKASHTWPTPYTIASGLLVIVSFFHYFYSPLRWVGLAAVAVGVPPIVLRSLVSIRRCVLDINVLMLIAVAGAIALGDYLEAGSIVFLFTLADWLESRSSDKARIAISAVASLAPQHAVLAENGLKVPVADVKVGTKLSVKAGEQIPIDGIVVSGKSAVDESSLTGESFPVKKETGARVWAGTINLIGYLCVETSALAEDSAVAKMVRLVEEAQTQRSRIDQLVEHFAKYYTPVIVVAAMALAVIPLSLHLHNLRHWLYLALVLLVVACPCALVISTPITTTCAIAEAARMGLIVKGGKYLEALGKLKVVAMDKTGTLTEGHFQVAQVLAVNKNTNLEKVLSWVSCIESKSSHPIASSIVAFARLHDIEPSGDVENFTILAGEGVSGVINGHLVCIGNERLANRLHWTKEGVVEPGVLEAWKRRGLTICWIGVDERPEIILAAGDQLRTEAPNAISELRDLGLHIAMLTGDSLAVANAVHRQLEKIDVHAELRPEDKVEVLKQLKVIGLTAMVGDGINDAPALAAADVGIAMGVAGSAIAMETANIALMTNDLRKLGVAVQLGRKARRKIQQNIVLSFATKLLIIVLAALGHASLWGAVLADVGTCLLVIFNSMLLLRSQEHRGPCIGHSHGNKHCHKGHTHHKHLKKCSEGGICPSKEKLLGSFRSKLMGSHIFQDSQDKLENCCVEKSCCELNCKSAKSGIRKRKDACSRDCQGLNCSSAVLTISEGVSSVSHTAGESVELGNCCAASSCCELSAKSPRSGVRKRSGHKDTCSKDCQGIECFSTSLIMSDGSSVGRSVEDGCCAEKACCEAGRKSSNSVLWKMSPKDTCSTEGSSTMLQDREKPFPISREGTKSSHHHHHHHHQQHPEDCTLRRMGPKDTCTTEDCSPVLQDRHEPLNISRGGTKSSHHQHHHHDQHPQDCTHKENSYSELSSNSRLRTMSSKGTCSTEERSPVLQDRQEPLPISREATKGSHQHHHHFEDCRHGGNSLSERSCLKHRENMEGLSSKQSTELCSPESLCNSKICTNSCTKEEGTCLRGCSLGSPTSRRDKALGYGRETSCCRTCISNNKEKECC